MVDILVHNNAAACPPTPPLGCSQTVTALLVAVLGPADRTEATYLAVRRRALLLRDAGGISFSTDRRLLTVVHF